MQRKKFVTTFRKSQLARVGFWLMFLCDLVLAVFSPVFLFVASLVFHVVIYFVSLNLRCSFLSEMVQELSAQKSCAPAPAVVEYSQSLEGRSGSEQIPNSTK